MKYLKKIVVALLALVFLSWSAHSHAAPAGRVLIAAGDVIAMRDGKPLGLVDGSSVEAGDTIKVGDRSSVQLQMVDKAVIALRANSTLTLEAYRFDETGSNSQAFFNLLQGGLRAVTGLIGKRNRDHFRLNTPTATIGIRGTHFTVVQCAGNCLNADGSKATDGLFGGVTDGRIVVTNVAGHKEFSKNEYFFVANRDTAAKALPEPPVFLRDPQEARGRAKAGLSSNENSQRNELASKQEESVRVTAMTAPELMPAIKTETMTRTTVVDALEAAMAAATVALAPSRVTGGTAPVSNAPVMLGVAYSVSEAATNGGVAIGQQNSGFGTPPCVQTTRLVPVLEYRLSAQQWTTMDSTPINNPNGTTTPQTTVQNFVKTASVGVGSSASAGNVSWGQYLLTIDSLSTVGPSVGKSVSNTSIRLWAIGDGVQAPPTTGNFTYNWIGGTTPTDLATPTPRAGTLTSGGSIGVQFDTQTMSTLTPIQWSMPSRESSYSVAFQNHLGHPH